MTGLWNYTPDEPNPLPHEPQRSGGKVEKISDVDGQSIYEQSIAAYRADHRNWKDLHKRANEGRKGSNHYEAAHLYLAMAVILSDSGAVQTRPTTGLTAQVVYHRSGHSFRECGLLNRAGDAYWRSGCTHTNLEQKARSLSRAKACYAEVGDIERADMMHRCEWQARREASRSASRAKDAASFMERRRHGLRAITLGVWFMTSKYGTSVGRWLLCLAGFLVVFTALYQGLQMSGAITTPSNWTPGLSSLYYTVTSSVTLDHIPISGWLSMLVVLVNVILANALLAVGLTVVGQKVLRR